MVILNNISAASYTTFGTDVNIDTLISIEDSEDYYYLEDLATANYKVIGGGSNILCTQDISDPLLIINTVGKEIVKEGEDYLLVKFAAGESWHDAVMWAVENNYGGIENLSLIPGKCGAAPIQNIGAYGVEIKNVLHTVKAYDRKSGVIKSFHNQECHFGYRSSNFKTTWKDQYIITDIILRLTRPNHHIKNTSYGAITKELEKQNITQPTIQDVSDAVIRIRQSKLPDPAKIGNAGSFFKNPIVDIDIYKRLSADYPDMPHYPAGSDVKLAAGWLIDQCGWKGKRVGNTGTYTNQALVLVNHGNATGHEVMEVAHDIISDVNEKFGIEIEPEVNVW